MRWARRAFRRDQLHRAGALRAKFDADARHTACGFVQRELGVNRLVCNCRLRNLTTNYVEYTAQLTAPLLAVPSDLVLRVYRGWHAYAEWRSSTSIASRYFRRRKPLNPSLVRASRVEDPESYDGIDGLAERCGK